VGCTGRLQLVLIVILGCCSAIFAQEKASPSNADQAMTPEKAGRDLFRAYCAVCHGTDAKGDGPAAPGLKKRPPDLSRLSRKNGGKFLVQLASSVIQGNDLITDHGTREMPMWGDAFRAMNGDETMVQSKIRNLTAYIESIQRRY
jgi:mono/diheme cytochrome c family protein